LKPTGREKVRPVWKRRVGPKRKIFPSISEKSIPYEKSSRQRGGGHKNDCTDGKRSMVLQKQTISNTKLRIRKIIDVKGMEHVI